MAVSLSAEPVVHYELSFPNAAHHEAEVQATFSGLGSEPLEIVMSRSSPGRYSLHEFAKNVSNFHAADAAGRALKFLHNSPSSWTVTPREGTLVCFYTVYGDRLDGTYAAIDLTHAHLNLPSILVWARGLENAAATFRFHVPPDSGWKAATQLIPNEDGTFAARNLAGNAVEWMMDSPVELSASPIREWRQENAIFRLALHQQGSEADAAAFAELCKTVIAEERGIFGEFPKYDTGTYTLLVDYLPYASGDGMEHRDSAVISGPLDLQQSSHRAIATVSHEFFHSWNVKRFRPRSLEPFDFERAATSGELWFAEGFTNYYSLLVLRRAGIDSLDEFIGGMSGALNSVLTDPGRLVASAVEMSQQAALFDGSLSIDPTNLSNNFISYYTYGQALAFGIDLTIRSRFPGKSLDDWMRTVWHDYPDVSQPYRLEDLQRTLAEATGDPQFAREIFEAHIQGRKPLDYEHLAAAAGLVVTLAHPGQVWLGATRINATSEGLELIGPTLRGSPLYLAGVDSGDAIQDCGGKSVKTLGKLDSCLAAYKPGDALALRVKGRGSTRPVVITLAQDPAMQLISFEKLGRRVTPEMTDFRNRWLSSRATRDQR